MNIKKIIFNVITCLSLISMILSPFSNIKVYADEKIEVSTVESVVNTQVSDTYITGYLDENGEIQFYNSVGQDRSVTLTIAVYVGTALVGYLVASVIDGIVISATGKSGGEWVATAIRSVLGKKYRSSISISGPYTCPGFVIDHSGMCS